MLAHLPARIDWPTSQARARAALDITRQAISDMFALKLDIGEFIITKGSWLTCFMGVLSAELTRLAQGCGLAQRMKTTRCGKSTRQS